MHYRTKSIKVHGVLYKPGAIIRVNMTEPLHDDIPFCYVLIKDIYVYKDHKLIIGQRVEYIWLLPTYQSKQGENYRTTHIMLCGRSLL